MNNFLFLDEIIQNAKYENSAEKFFKNFIVVWNNVKFQVLKLETKQEYIESDVYFDESLSLMLSGNYEKARKVLKKSLEDDDGMYLSLKKRGIDFIRCRPVDFPVCNYLKLEIESYKITQTKGERIFLCKLENLKKIFQKIATYDFMVFDSEIAFVHNYDENGLIQGGWIIKDKKHIIELQKIFIYIKSHSLKLDSFVKENESRVSF